MPLIDRDKITITIKKIKKSSFTILDFMETFRQLFPEDWKMLTEKYGLMGDKKRYTTATYLSNRLYNYSHKNNSLLKPFKKYRKGGKGDYRRTEDKERKNFGSPWIAIYNKKN